METEAKQAQETARAKQNRGWLYCPAFPDHWEHEPLYSMAEWVNGLAFRKIQFSPTGKPVIKIAEIKDGVSGQTEFTEQEFDESVHLRAGDLLFSWSGQPETSIDAFWWRGPEGWLNQHVFRITPRRDIDRTFFYYLLKYLKPNFIGIARNKQTTGLGHVTKRDLESIQAAYPLVPEQRTIAHILGTLDDKIELNRRMNETLEAMARAIFKSWFVDFDPVRAKAEGRQPFGMDAETAALFPDSFQDSPLGKIPKGWRAGCLGDISENPRRGVNPGRASKETPYIGLEHMPRKSIALGNCGHSGEVASNKFSFRQGEILFGKLRPYFHKVGVAVQDGVCSTDILVVTAKSEEWFGFVLGHVSSEEFVAYTDAVSTGTKMPRTNWQDMARYEIAVPDSRLADAFGRFAKAVVDKIRLNILQSVTLTTIRDTLLPKLISGEIRVKDTEQLVPQGA